MKCKSCNKAIGLFSKKLKCNNCELTFCGRHKAEYSLRTCNRCELINKTGRINKSDLKTWSLVDLLWVAEKIGNRVQENIQENKKAIIDIICDFKNKNDNDEETSTDDQKTTVLMDYDVFAGQPIDENCTVEQSNGTLGAVVEEEENEVGDQNDNGDIEEAVEEDDHSDHETAQTERPTPAPRILDLAQMSVRQLKEYMTNHNIDFQDCTERYAMIEMIEAFHKVQTVTISTDI